MGKRGERLKKRRRTKNIEWFARVGWPTLLVRARMIGMPQQDIDRFAALSPDFKYRRQEEFRAVLVQYENGGDGIGIYSPFRPRW